MPITPAAYIHRVGRTARAGRAGSAWTLVEWAHARRFWRELAGREGGGGECTIVRAPGRTVERLDLYEGRPKESMAGRADGIKDDGGGDFTEERKEAYRKALEQMEAEAADPRGKRDK